MINFDEVSRENGQEYNPHWSQIPNHPYRILIIGDSRSGKTNALLSLIYHQPDIDNTFLNVKNPDKSRYQYLVKKQKKVSSKSF